LSQKTRNAENGTTEGKVTPRKIPKTVKAGAYLERRDRTKAAKKERKPQEKSKTVSDDGTTEKKS